MTDSVVERDAAKTAVEKLRKQLSGKVLIPGDSDYQGAREVWNAMIDRHPAVIVQCASSADVALALKHASQHGYPISIRGGGHHIAGNSVCDDGLVIDFSAMKDIRVDVEQRRASVQPGVTLGEFDKAVQRYGLATPVGINSTTGISGLTLGGGFGWLTRKYGLTVDNLESAEVVTSHGVVLTASENENSDLFWAIRGGGGNFGVVTNYEYRLHHIGTDVTAGLIVFPLDQAETVMTGYLQYMDTAPEELNVWLVSRQAPPLPFLEDSVHGTPILALAICHAGDPADAPALIEPLRNLATPCGEHVGVQPYVAWQQAFDPLLTPGARNYWKSHNFTRINPSVISSTIDYTLKLPSPECEIFFGLIAGAANRVPSDAMAYGHRDARYVLNVHGRWQDAKDDEAGIRWARDFFQETLPHASSGAYINFLTEDEADRSHFAYGENYKRLAEIKKRYDPDNLFRSNLNIKPA